MLLIPEFLSGFYLIFFLLKLRVLSAWSRLVNCQINFIEKAIKDIVNSDLLPDTFKYNLKLIRSIPGMGFIISVTVMAEFGDFNNLKKPKELVAFLGLDPSVFESAKFKSTKNKLSKRGSTFARRALYTVALASVRVSTNGSPVNPVLLDYYNSKLANKKKMVAIIAIMHKLTNYVFSVLRDQQEYVLRWPSTHQKCFFSNKSVA